ncbi:MAG: hypothetical protein Q7S02_03220 [bacterium]|nr:hypothetical protein [bacterium]
MSVQRLLKLDVDGEALMAAAHTIVLDGDEGEHSAGRRVGPEAAEALLRVFLDHHKLLVSMGINDQGGRTAEAKLLEFAAPSFDAPEDQAVVQRAIAFCRSYRPERRTS